MGEPNDFINNYLRYVGVTETPTTYHRWCAISILGAYLGRQFSLPFGHSRIHTNMYTMLIGVPGARKSTAIKISKKIITMAGYDTISADKSSKEKFMLDLAGEDTGDLGDILDQKLFGSSGSDDCKEMFIACDEFNDFIGNGNVEFISLLGNMWDFEGVFKNRIKTGKSVEINNPTISILGGNTAVNFARAFPPDTLGQGFFSRLLLIYGEPTGRKIAFPVPPAVEETEKIVAQLVGIKRACYGIADLEADAVEVLEQIYVSYVGVGDMRFDSYSNRRFTHLLKMALICCASAGEVCVTKQHVIYANTILTHAEYLMPKALGEFGKSKNSDVSHKVMQVLESAVHPMTLKDIWVYVSTDLEKLNDLIEMLRNLVTADKVFNAGGGFLAKRKTRLEDVGGLVDFGLLTQEERDMIL